MNLTLLNEGIIVTILGMGTVFFFLALMIWVMDMTENILKFIGKFFPEEVAEVQTTKKKTTNNDEEVAVAIACAIRGAQ